MSPANESDDDLAKIVATQRSQQAFEVLFDRHAVVVDRFISGRIHERFVQEINQDTWLKAWEKASLFKGGSYRAWLFTIAGNLVKDKFEKRSTSEQHLGEHDVTTLYEKPETTLDENESKRLADCLKQLSDDAKKLVSMRLGGESYDAVCETLHITSAQAHKRWHTALTKLQECVKPTP